jgi:hypothetical protein
VGRHMDRYTLKIIAVLMFTWSAQCATYYIDYAGGADANNGTSTGTAWKRHPAMPGYSGSYSHNPADRFYFIGGGRWPSNCFPMSPSTAGGGTNYQYWGVHPDYYTGGSFTKPVFDGGGTNQVIISQFINAKPNLIIDSIQMENFYWHSGDGTSYIRAVGDSNVIILNCLFWKWTHSANGLDDLQVVKGSTQTAGNPGCYASNCVWDGSQSMDSGAATYAWPRVINSRSTNMANHFLVSGPTRAEVAYNIIGPTRNSYQNSLPGMGGSYHPNSVQQVGGSSAQIDIHHNVIFGALGICIFVGSPSGGLGGPSAGPAFIYNNLIYDSQPIPIQIDGRDGGSFASIWNNTIVYDGSVVRNDQGTVWTVTNRNNHIIGTGAAISPDTSNNLIQTAATASGQGYEEANLWQPTSGGSTINAGTNLSIYFTTDRLGNTRSGTWDIGAYEYGASEGGGEPASGSGGSTIGGGVTISGGVTIK